MVTSIVGVNIGLKRLCRTLSWDEDGQDMVEYALLAGMISIAAIAVIILLGPYLQNAFRDVINAINSA